MAETVYRITTFFNRKPGITEEQFNHHWETIHAPLVAPWAVRHGFVQYTQFHTPLSLRQKLAPSGSSSPGILPYDAAVDWYVPSYEAYAAAFQDPYYVHVIEPDEWNFVDKGAGKEVVGMVSTLGVARDVVKGGKSCIEEVDGEEKTVVGV